MKTESDLALMRETGFCAGMENYSRHLANRQAGDPPDTLVHYFKKSFGKDWLLVVDESHVTLPQIGGMWGADRARKVNLVNHGFRYSVYIYVCMCIYVCVHIYMNSFKNVSGKIGCLWWMRAM